MAHRYLRDQVAIVSQLCTNSPINTAAVNNTAAVRTALNTQRTLGRTSAETRGVDVSTGGSDGSEAETAHRIKLMGTTVASITSAAAVPKPSKLTIRTFDCRLSFISDLLMIFLLNSSLHQQLYFDSFQLMRKMLRIINES